MPYLPPDEQRRWVLSVLAEMSMPCTRLEIAEILGYKTPSSLQTTMHRLEQDGSINRWNQTKPNGQIRHMYQITPKGFQDLEHLNETVKNQRLIGFE